MSVVELTNDTFKEFVTTTEVTIVDFYSTSCGPCRALLPTLQALSETAKVGKVNVYEESELAVEYDVSGLPTIIFFKDGQVVEKMLGLQSREALEAKLAQHK